MNFSNYHAMDPNYDQKLRDEVLYLHSLWHQGPPGRRNPNSQPSPSVPHPVSISAPPLKKQKKASNPEPAPDSGLEWPCPEPVQISDHTNDGWPAVKPTLAPEIKPISAADRSRHAALQIQYKIAGTCREFLAGDSDSESDEDDESLEEKDEEGGEDEEEEEEEEEEGDEEEQAGDNEREDGLEGRKEYKFFLKIFMENNELRDYYKKNYESGIFGCLVCQGIGKKNSGKRFKDCLALVNHSISILKTTNRKAHKAFGKVICNVLGWDFNRLPTIVLNGEPLHRSSGDGNADQVNNGQKDVASVSVNGDEDNVKMLKVLMVVDLLKKRVV